MSGEQTHLLSEQVYGGAPANYRDALRGYIEQHTPPGDFLTAFLANDLMGVITHAGYVNRQQIVELMTWVFSYAPWQCHGSYEAVNSWLTGSET